jgi:hypothetical protein
LDAGSTSPITALAAMVASIALPPFSRICTPARAASGLLDATMPSFVITMDRPVTTGLAGRRAAALSTGSCALHGDVDATSAMASVMTGRGLLMSAPGRLEIGPTNQGTKSRMPRPVTHGCPNRAAR